MSRAPGAVIGPVTPAPDTCLGLTLETAWTQGGVHCLASGPQLTLEPAKIAHVLTGNRIMWHTYVVCNDISYWP